MEFIEEKIEEYKNNCKLDFRGIQNPICKLSGKDVLLLEDLSQLANLYLKGYLSDLLKKEFENRIQNLKTNLDKDELLKRLINL